MENKTYHPSKSGVQHQRHQRDDQPSPSQNGSSGAPAPASVEALKTKISVLQVEVAQSLRDASCKYNSPSTSFSEDATAAARINQALLSIQHLVPQDLPYSVVVKETTMIGIGCPLYPLLRSSRSREAWMLAKAKAIPILTGEILLFKMKNGAISIFPKAISFRDGNWRWLERFISVSESLPRPRSFLSCSCQRNLVIYFRLCTNRKHVKFTSGSTIPDSSFVHIETTCHGHAPTSFHNIHEYFSQLLLLLSALPLESKELASSYAASCSSQRQSCISAIFVSFKMISWLYLIRELQPSLESIPNSMPGFFFLSLSKRVALTDGRDDSLRSSHLCSTKNRRWY